MLSASASMMSILASRTLAQYATRQTKMIREAAANSVGAMSQFSEASAKAARRTVKPVRKRVKQNVRRFVKR
jgi:phasin family protein